MSSGDLSSRFLKLHAEGNVQVARVRVARLTEDVNLEQFGHELFALVEQSSCRKLVVDLAEVNAITSAGLGKMIALHRKVHRLQGGVVFCHVQPAVAEVLETSRLSTYLVIAPDVPRAVANLAN
ncbi:MAG: STAS domain-containing protein [Planctomycetaceae bacterium]